MTIRSGRQEVGDGDRLARELRVVGDAHGGVDGAHLAGDVDGRARQQRAADDDGARQLRVRRRCRGRRPARSRHPTPRPASSVPTQTMASSAPRMAAWSSAKRRRPSREALGHQLVQARLVHGQVARAQARHARRVHVQADDVMPQVRQAGGGHQADVAGADDGDVHRPSVPDGGLRRRSWCVEAPPDEWRHARGALPFRVMRRPQSASGLAAVMASLFVVSLVAAPVSRQVARGAFACARPGSGPAECTPWSSEFAPPPTIRVLRSQRDLVAPEVVGHRPGGRLPRLRRHHDGRGVAGAYPARDPQGRCRGHQAVRLVPRHPPARRARGPARRRRRPATTSSTPRSTSTTTPRSTALGLPDGPGRKIMAALDETWDVTVRKYSPADAGAAASS